MPQEGAWVSAQNLYTANFSQPKQYTVYTHTHTHICTATPATHTSWNTTHTPHNTHRLNPKSYLIILFPSHQYSCLVSLLNLWISISLQVPIKSYFTPYYNIYHAYSDAYEKKAPEYVFAAFWEYINAIKASLLKPWRSTNAILYPFFFLPFEAWDWGERGRESGARATNKLKQVIAPSHRQFGLFSPPFAAQPQG